MFAGEYVDHGGNRCCGQDFMAGTICSLPPGHPGAHGTTCQVCSGDWYMGGCACHPDACTLEEGCSCSECEERELDLGWFEAARSQPVTREEIAETFGVDPAAIPNID